MCVLFSSAKSLLNFGGDAVFGFDWYELKAKIERRYLID